MKGTVSWLVLFIAGIFLIVIGFEGALGRVIAVAFSPGSLAYYADAGTDTTAFTPTHSTSDVPSFTI